MNKTWLSGKITEEEMKEHHPLEYERIKSAEEKIDINLNSI